MPLPMKDAGRAGTLGAKDPTQGRNRSVPNSVQKERVRKQGLPYVLVLHQDKPAMPACPFCRFYLQHGLLQPELHPRLLGDGEALHFLLDRLLGLQGDFFFLSLAGDLFLSLDGGLCWSLAGELSLSSGGGRGFSTAWELGPSPSWGCCVSMARALCPSVARCLM